MDTNKIFNALNVNPNFRTLNTINGCKIVAIEYTAGVKMNKRGNPLADFIVTKRVKMTCQFGYNYQNAVNNRAERTGNERDFIAETLPWGSWLVPNKFILHNNSIYVRFYGMKNGQASVSYYVNSLPATETETAIIKQFLPVRKESARQAEAGVEGDDQVKPFNINIENIVKVTYKGNE